MSNSRPCDICDPQAQAPIYICPLCCVLRQSTRTINESRFPGTTLENLDINNSQCLILPNSTHKPKNSFGPCDHRAPPDLRPVQCAVTHRAATLNASGSHEYMATKSYSHSIQQPSHLVRLKPRVKSFSNRRSLVMAILQ